MTLLVSDDGDADYVGGDFESDGEVLVMMLMLMMMVVWLMLLLLLTLMMVVMDDVHVDQDYYDDVVGDCWLMSGHV